MHHRQDTKSNHKTPSQQKQAETVSPKTSSCGEVTVADVSTASQSVQSPQINSLLDEHKNNDDSRSFQLRDSSQKNSQTESYNCESDRQDSVRTKPIRKYRRNRKNFKNQLQQENSTHSNTVGIGGSHHSEPATTSKDSTDAPRNMSHTKDFSETPSIRKMSVITEPVELQFVNKVASKNSGFFSKNKSQRKNSGFSGRQGKSIQRDGICSQDISVSQDSYSNLTIPQNTENTNTGSACILNNHSRSVTENNHSRGVTENNHNRSVTGNNHSRCVTGNNHNRSVTGNNYSHNAIENNHSRIVTGNNELKSSHLPKIHEVDSTPLDNENSASQIVKPLNNLLESIPQIESGSSLSFNTQINSERFQKGAKEQIGRVNDTREFRYDPFGKKIVDADFAGPQGSTILSSVDFYDKSSKIECTSNAHTNSKGVSDHGKNQDVFRSTVGKGVSNVDTDNNSVSDSPISKGVSNVETDNNSASILPMSKSVLNDSNAASHFFKGDSQPFTRSRNSFVSKEENTSTKQVSATRFQRGAALKSQMTSVRVRNDSNLSHQSELRAQESNKSDRINSGSQKVNECASGSQEVDNNLAAEFSNLSMQESHRTSEGVKNSTSQSQRGPTHGSEEVSILAESNGSSYKHKERPIQGENNSSSYKHKEGPIQGENNSSSYKHKQESIQDENNAGSKPFRRGSLHKNDDYHSTSPFASKNHTQTGSREANHPRRFGSNNKSSSSYKQFHSDNRPPHSYEQSHISNPTRPPHSYEQSRISNPTRPPHSYEQSRISNPTRPPTNDLSNSATPPSIDSQQKSPFCEPDNSKIEYDPFGRPIAHHQKVQYDTSAWDNLSSKSTYIPPHLRDASFHDDPSHEEDTHPFNFYFHPSYFEPLTTPKLDQFNLLKESINYNSTLKPLLDFNDLVCPQIMADYLKTYKPAPIQSFSIPSILSKSNILCRAPTGSGKTLAFLIPIVLQLKKLRKPILRALILTPTRELALQIYKQLEKITTLKSCLIYGGKPINNQAQAIRTGVDICISTPGRLCDLLERKMLSLKNVKHFVLDEADRMLEMGFEKDLSTIKSYLTTHLVYLFSATFEKNVMQICDRMMKNYIKIEVKKETLKNIKQEFVHITHERHRTSTFIDLLKRNLKELSNNINNEGQGSIPDRSKYLHDPNKKDSSPINTNRGNLIDSEVPLILVFTETKSRCKSLERIVNNEQILATSIHGDKDQKDREKSLDLFTKRKINVLIATSVAARGLDIPNINLVINYEMPQNIKEYIHRIGRSGRSGKNGKSISFISDKDIQIIKNLIEVLNESKNLVPTFFKSLSHKEYRVSQGDRNSNRGYGDRSYGNRNYSDNRSYGRVNRYESFSQHECEQIDTYNSNFNNDDSSSE